LHLSPNSHPFGVLKCLHSSVLTFAKRNGSPRRFWGVGLGLPCVSETVDWSDAVDENADDCDCSTDVSRITVQTALSSELRVVIDGSDDWDRGPCVKGRR
jgi:hypothetical protein